MSVVSPPTPVQRKPRRRWFYLGAFVLVLIATPFAYRSFATWQRERELAAIYAEMDAQDPNWRLPDLVASLPAQPPDDQNAAVQILKVHAPITRSGFSLVKSSATATNYPNSRLPEQDAAALRAALGKLDKASLEEARKLKDLPDGRFPIKPSENPFEPPDQFGNQFCIVDVTRLLRHDAIRRADEGNTEGAAESCQALLHSTNAINDAPSLMAGLIHVAVCLEAVGPVERMLGHGGVSEERLKLLQSALVREAECNALYHALRGERASNHQIYLLLSEGKMAFPPEFRRTGWRRLLDILYPLYSLGDQPDELRLLNELVAACQLDDEIQTAAFDAVQAKMANAKSNFAQSILSLTKSMAAEHLMGRAHLRCAATGIAAERFRLDKGRWPTSATELVNAGFMKTVYKDPFDGQPLRWKRTATGLMIYSVGPDRIDNNGKLNRLNPQAPGSDIGFELWLPSHRRLPAPQVAADPR